MQEAINDIKPEKELEAPYFIVMFSYSNIEGGFKCECGNETLETIKGDPKITCKQCGRSYAISHIMRLREVNPFYEARQV